MQRSDPATNHLYYAYCRGIIHTLLVESVLVWVLMVVTVVVAECC